MQHGEQTDPCSCVCDACLFVSVVCFAAACVGARCSMLMLRARCSLLVDLMCAFVYHIYVTYHP